MQAHASIDLDVQIRRLDACYGVATISRLLKFKGLFCKSAL